MAKNRNRSAGNGYELTTAHRLRECGYPEAASTRECNKARDNKKVDICNRNEGDEGEGRMPFNIQCKNLCTNANYVKILQEMEKHNGTKRPNIVLHKKTKKVGTKFMPEGEYAIMSAESFYELLVKFNKLCKEGQ